MRAAHTRTKDTTPSQPRSQLALSRHTPFTTLFLNKASGYDSSLVSALLIHATRDEVQLVVDNLRGMGVDVRHVSGLHKYG